MLNVFNLDFYQTYIKIFRSSNLRDETQYCKIITSMSLHRLCILILKALIIFNAF